MATFTFFVIEQTPTYPVYKGGTIVIDETPYSISPDTTPSIQLATGSHLIQVVIPSGYRFLYWKPVGSVTVADIYADLVGFTISGDAAMVAWIALALSATLSASPTSGPVPLAVTFTIGITGGVTPYTWTLDYGDATTPGSGTVAGTKAHTYTRVGTFTATLTVTDALGASIVSRSKVMSGVTAVKQLVSILAPLVVGAILIKVAR